MSTDDVTVTKKTSTDATDKARAEKLQYIKNQIKTGKLAIMDKKNKGFAASCAKIAKKLVS